MTHAPATEAPKPTPAGTTPEAPKATTASSPSFGAKAKEFLGKMSETGKAMVSKAYEAVAQESPDKTVGKMKVAYDQLWIDGLEGSNAKLGAQVASFDVQLGALDESQKEIASMITEFKAGGIPGIEALQLQQKRIDQQKRDLENKKDVTRTKQERKADRVKLWTAERDRTADKLIAGYKEKIKPVEKELDILRGRKDAAELLIVGAELKFKDKVAKFDELEKKQNEAEAKLRKAGISEGKIRDIFKVSDKFRNESRSKIQAEKDKLNQKKAEIDKKISKFTAKADPYRNKMAAYQRLKDGDRPIDNRPVGFRSGRETTSAGEGSGTPIESGGVKVENLSLTDYIDKWNDLQKSEGFRDPSWGEEAVIDPTELRSAFGLPTDYKPTPSEFKNLLELYFKKDKRVEVKDFDKKIKRLDEEMAK